MNGRIRSLFELVLGFEPEDSGRDNIRHRGYLLGYTKQQIAELESEIIDFAGTAGVDRSSSKNLFGGHECTAGLFDLNGPRR